MPGMTGAGGKDKRQQQKRIGMEFVVMTSRMQATPPPKGHSRDK
jgi:hypothetical protein